MNMERGAGLPAVKVEDIVDIARAAGRVIMDVYKTDPEVRAGMCAHGCHLVLLYPDITEILLQHAA